MWAFGNSEAEPTQKYYYWNYVNSTQPYRVGVEQSTNSGAPYTTTFGVTFYDGLGRTLPSQSPIYVDGVARTTVDRTLYNVQGLVASAYAPISATATTVITNATFVNSGFTYATTTEYDSLGRVTKVTVPDGTFTSHRYDTSGAYTRYSIIDANRHRMEYYSDSLGRLAQVKELTGNCGTFSSGYDCNTAPYTTPWATYATTQYTYDMADRLTGVQDQAGNITTITYDVAGRKTGMTDPDMGAWGYFYDDAGNMVRQRDPRGQRICYFYDDLNRLRGKQYRTDDNCPTSLPSFGANVTLYEYDASDPANGQFGVGMRTRMVDQTGTTQWWYDQRGRVSKETKDIEVNANTYTFTSRYEYDTMNRVTKMWYPSNTSGGTESTPLTYAYHSVSEQLQSATFTSGSNSLSANDIHYNRYGQIQRMDYGSTPEVRQEYAYWDLNQLHGLGRLRSVQAGRIGISTTEAQWMAYRDPFDTTYNTPGYDAVGNVLAIVDKNAGGSAPSHQYQVYEYDHLNRMVRAEIAGGSTGTWAAQKYVYDVIGNLDEVRDANTNIMQKNYTYNSTQPHAVDLVTSGAYSYGYGYDAAGNMTNRDGQELLAEAGITLNNVKEWTEQQIIAVAEGVGDLSRAIGSVGQLNKLIGGYATFYLPTVPAPLNCLGGPACALPPPLSDGHSVYFTDYKRITKYDTVHELGHVIDWNSSIVYTYEYYYNGMLMEGTATGSFSTVWGIDTTAYSSCLLCVQAWESWADGVALYVYGGEYYWGFDPLMTRPREGARDLNAYERKIMRRLLSGDG